MVQNAQNTFQYQSANTESAEHHINSPTEPIICAAVTHACLGSGVFVFNTTTPFPLIFSSRSGNCSAFNWASFCQPPKETFPQSLSDCPFHFCLLLLLSLLACWGSKSNISNLKTPLCLICISENEDVLKVCKSMKRQKTISCLPFYLCAASRVRKPVTNAGAAVGCRRRIFPSPWNRGDLNIIRFQRATRGEELLCFKAPWTKCTML